MQDKLTNFEEQIRLRMKDFESPESPKPDFDALETRMKADAKADELEFDQIVRDAARRAQPNYVPKTHWEMMERQLDATFTLRGKLMRYRVMELTLLALFGWSVVNVVDSQQNYEKNVPVFQQKAENINKGKEEKGQPKIDLQQFNPSPQNWRNRSNNATPQRTSETPIVKTENGNLPAENQLLNQFSMQQQQSVIALQDLNGGKENSRNEGVNELINTEKQLEKAGENALSSASNIVLAATELKNGSDTGGGALAAVEIVELLPTLEIAPMKADLTALKPVSAIIIQPRSSRWSIGLAAMPSIDFGVSTLRDSAFQRTRGDVTVNIGGGISLSRKLDDRLSLETGISYAAKSFRPVQANKISGNFDNYVIAKIDKVNMKVVAIPLHANYLLSQSRRWAFRAHVGTSLNAAVQTDYDVTLSSQNRSVQITNPSFGNTANLEKTLPQTYSNAAEANGKLTTYNLFSTIDVGLNAEYKISRKWSIFAKPTWMQHIGKGIGVNADRLSSFVFNAGTKVDL